MKQKDITGIVPEQYTGSEIKAGADVELNSDKEAENFYKEARARLLQVNNWHHLAGIFSATFQLVEASGNEVNRDAQKGDYFKIDIPGPGSKEGDGYDWVRIEEFKEIKNADVECTAFRVRPTSNPGSGKEETAHFYSEESTSNFMVSREGKKISALIIDSNIKPNDNADSLTDKIRHLATGVGAIAMFSKAQWQRLAEALVSRKKND